MKLLPNMMIQSSVVHNKFKSNNSFLSDVVINPYHFDTGYSMPSETFFFFGHLKSFF